MSSTRVRNASLWFLLLAGLASAGAACVVAEQPTIGNFNNFSGNDVPLPPRTAAAASCDGGTTASGDAGSCAVSFSNSVIPILSSKCLGCHVGQGNPQIVFPADGSVGGYYEALQKAQFTGGTYLDICNPSKSGFACNVEATVCTPKGTTMPPGAPLAESDKQIIAGWIACGAPNN